MHKKKTYDKDLYEPIIHSSICTGEKVVGFKNKKTKEFIEMKLILTQKDLEDFMNEYDIDFKIKTEY